MKMLKINPKNLDLTIAEINKALEFIDRNVARHNFKEQLVIYYEQ